MNDVVGKVRKLIALSIGGAEDDNEARSAAVRACRLIHDHKLLVIAAPERSPTDVVEDPQKPHRTTAQVPSSDLHEDISAIVSHTAGRVASTVVSELLGGRRRRRSF